MSRPTAQKIEYSDFKRALERAVAAGTRISTRDAERWATYVTAKGVREHNFKAFLVGQYDKLEAVIIDDPGEWGGYYLWSALDEVAFRWHRPSE